VNPPTRLFSFAANVWTMSFPLRALGINVQRNVTIVRLASGKLIIHSTAPFTGADVAAIRELGSPEWVVDVLLRHDTFSVEGSHAFPVASYLTPPGFEAPAGVIVSSLLPPPLEWENEISVLPIDGAPSFGEIVMLHKPSGTLIVGDLLFNFTGHASLWKRLLLSLGSVGGKYDPGFTRPFKSAITDRGAFSRSVSRVLDWDFDRIIVGHGNPILTGGKETLRRTLTAAGIAGL